ncbi:MAG TPA: 30S ribosomal protein S6 [Anaerolineales bacterium]|nr:30S ribosomal protein S6 [Anaerolineales bacterium]
MYPYELAVIISPDLEGPALDEMLARVEGWITKSGGEIVRRATWGKRKLAYSIRKKQEGHYFFWYIHLPGNAVAEVERNMRLNEGILRFLSLHLDEIPAEDAPAPSERIKVQDEDDDYGSTPRYRRQPAREVSESDDDEE